MCLLSDDCTNLDVAEGETYSMEPQAAASLAVVKERKYFQSNENKIGYIIFTVSLKYHCTYSAKNKNLKLVNHF